MVGPWVLLTFALWGPQGPQGLDSHLELSGGSVEPLLCANSSPDTETVVAALYIPWTRTPRFRSEAIFPGPKAWFEVEVLGSKAQPKAWKTVTAAEALQ